MLRGSVSILVVKGNSIPSICWRSLATSLTMWASGGQLIKSSPVQPNPVQSNPTHYEELLTKSLAESS